ncbi:hypothetical protein INT46_005985 [Mucor plumbeus]|uniref:Uncharacterized protein n=1 Tax=Mucor plumbeus TaxID=97098 RepID=A0A8H7VB24_9FUNG|nr:hypothetical protein INT46_005985 [Mucor plumbeus]
MFIALILSLFLNQSELNLNAQDKSINYADIADIITSAKNEIILHIDQFVEKIQNSINAATIVREPNVNAMPDTSIANMSNNNLFKEFRIKQPKRRNGEYAPDKVKALFKQELEGKYSMEHVISVLYKEFDDQCVEVMHTYIEMLKQQSSEDMPVWSNISPHNRRVTKVTEKRKTELEIQKKRKQVEEEKNDNYDNEEDDRNEVDEEDNDNDNQDITPSTIITRSKTSLKNDLSRRAVVHI